MNHVPMLRRRSDSVRAKPAAAPFSRGRALFTMLGVIVPMMAVTACGASADKSPVPSSSGESATVFADASSAKDPLAPMPLKEETTITLAMPQLTSFIEAPLADYFGEFKKENLIVKISALPLADVQAALQTGALDVGGASFTPAVLNLANSGTDIRMVFPGAGAIPGTKSGFFIRKEILNGSGKVDPAKAKGMTVSTPAGNQLPAVGWLIQYLQTHGAPDLKVTDLKFQSLDQQSSSIAIQNGAVDATYAGPPFNEILLSSSCCQRLDIDIAHTSGYFFGKNLRVDRPEVGLAFIRAISRTVRDYLQPGYAKNEKVIDALAAVTKLPTKTFTDNEEKLYDPKFSVDSGFAEQSQKYFLSVPDTLQYTKPLPKAMLIDTRFVDVMNSGSS